ncbi:MAG TPA: TIGR02234 family membrane protein [Mycobacterium sp.]|nr:TIGR02234 family membrane protein [Mycobacterium sp.]
MANAQPERPGRHTLRLAQALLVVAAAGLWAASRLTWVDLRTFDGLGPPKLVTLPGATWSSGLVPLALLLLATALAALAVRGWPLRMLSLLLAVASLAIGYLAISLWVIPDVAVRGADIAHVPVLTLEGSQRHYPGPAITLVTAICTLVAAVLLMRAAASAPGTVTKYLTPAARRALSQPDEKTMSERMIWDALDEGRDPTDQPQEPDRETRHDPDTEGR